MKKATLTYTSSISDICENNSSFDSAKIRVAYPGLNRNGSYISKDTFEKCIKSIYNVPVVCNYNRDTDSLGGHDMELIKLDDGIKLVNVTQPVGVVPESAEYSWETITEEDGTNNEYLCVDVLLWKRQEAYKKIKEDGITAQSMEITVKEDSDEDGVWHINDFEFTALCLIGVEPCFESSALVFNKKEFSEEFSMMLRELKEEASKMIDTSFEVDNIKDNSTKGGCDTLENITNTNEETIIEKHIDDESANMNNATDTVIDNDADHTEDNSSFELNSNIEKSLKDSLASIEVETSWGKCLKYWYVDYDAVASEVYCEDSEDWKLYGFKFSIDGDNAVIDFDTKRRKKYQIVDFDEGDTDTPTASAQVFTKMSDIISESTNNANSVNEKYEAISSELNTAKAEIDSLKEFKANVQKEEMNAKISELFSAFEDLNGIESFESLKGECAEDCFKYELSDIEDKCYSIRGRNMKQDAKFSIKASTPKIVIDKKAVDEDTDSEAPYGGFVEKMLSK